MRFSIGPDCGRPFSETSELTVHCESTGWDGAYIAEHFMPDTSDADSHAPVQSPLPLLVAGKGEQRTMPTAARFAPAFR